jgi:hypothetical protein
MIQLKSRLASYEQRHKLLACVALLTLVPACSAGSEGDSSPPSSETVAVDDHPDAIATLTLENGNVVEFFDFDTAALVVESGPAHQRPVLTDENLKNDRLVDTWNQFAHGERAPLALVDLQDRLATLEPTDPRLLSGEPAYGGAEFKFPPAAELGPDVQAVRDGCDNDCCNWEALSAVAECQSQSTFNWFAFNYGSTFANSGSDAQNYRGYVCAAVGTSTYRVAIGSAGGVWSVPQATWRKYWWNAPCAFGFCNGKTGYTSVNTASDQHLHSYCGSYFFN